MFEPGALNFSAFTDHSTKKTLWRKIVQLFTEGHFMDSKILQRFIRDNTGDVTFQVRNYVSSISNSLSRKPMTKLVGFLI